MKDSENKLSGSMHSFKRMLSFGILMVIAMTLFAQVKNVSGVVLDKKRLLNCSFQTKESLYITTIRLNEKNQAVQFSIE